METIHTYRCTDGTTGKIVRDKKNRKVFIVENRNGKPIKLNGNDAIVRLNEMISGYSQQLMDAKNTIDIYVKSIKEL